MIRLCALSLCVTLVGCATAAKPVTLPNGGQGYAVTCDDGTGSIAACMNHAAKVCGGAYTVLEREGGAQSAVAVPIGTTGGATFMGIPGARTILIRCGN